MRITLPNTSNENARGTTVEAKQFTVWPAPLAQEDKHNFEVVEPELLCAAVIENH